MSACSVTYGTPFLPNNKSITNYLSVPVYRVLHLHPLTSGSSYLVYLQCKDREDVWHISNTVYFTTGMLIM